VHGQGQLVSQSLTGGLEVVDAGLEPLLVPGRSSDLVVHVRNRGVHSVVADRVGLRLPLRDAKPAGCAAMVSGPLLGPGGVALTGSERTVVGPGWAGTIVVPSALSLATGANAGCGFKVTVDVRALQVPDRTPPPTSPTVSPPTMPPIDCDPVDPTCTPEPTATATPTPPSDLPPTVDCDPVDPTCTPAPTATPPTTTPTTTTPTPPSDTPPPVDCDPFDPTCSG
jgi:hypothetical protein